MKNSSFRFPIFPLILLLCLVFGCEQQGERVDVEKKAKDDLGLDKVPEKQVSVVTTPEIIRILEEEAVVLVATSHSQSIHIRLKDGTAYRGTYVPAEAGKYSKDPRLYDILNLVLYIKEHRPPEEGREWQIVCE